MSLTLNTSTVSDTASGATAPSKGSRRSVAVALAVAAVAIAAAAAGLALNGGETSAPSPADSGPKVVAGKQADNADPNLRNAIAEDSSAGRAMNGGTTK
ncbi:MAG: hypothetical protein ACT4QF_11125 [Sporichthyaceae bacterium]|jgi:flagellar basal body-associated protein FliL